MRTCANDDEETQRDEMKWFRLRPRLLISALRELSDGAYETYAHHALRGYCSCRVCVNLRALDAKRKSYEDWRRTKVEEPVPAGCG